MKRHFGIIATVVIVLLVLLGLNAAGTISLDRPSEDEDEPIRSSYNPGPTGARAFYQLLEESKYPVARWRESYKGLNLPASEGRNASLIVVGPFTNEGVVDSSEGTALRKWVAEGGRLLVVSRLPQGEFDDPSVVASARHKGLELRNAKPEEMVDPKASVLIAQPTGLTRGVHGLAVSKLASRLVFRPPSEDVKTEEPEAKTSPSPSGDQTAQEAGADKKRSSMSDAVAALASPIVHLGDGEGAVLIEFTFGKGRVIFLSDPFVIANNGIAQGANLNLALNLIDYVGQGKGRILFDEYHHGYQSQRNAMFSYFRGTPLPMVLSQLVIVALLVALSRGKRFARPLPVPVADRHSPLEFVGSMASLQKAADARDLALENIYPRFRGRVCRSLGLPVTASADSIVFALKRRGRVKASEVELLRIFSESEKVLAGEKMDDQRLVRLVASMREISRRNN